MQETEVSAPTPPSLLYILPNILLPCSNDAFTRHVTFSEAWTDRGWGYRSRSANAKIRVSTSLQTMPVWHSY